MIGGPWSPEAFRGARKHRNYFEGWYYKLIDRERGHVFAAIPGLSVGNNRNDAHAFVQFIDAVEGRTEYFRYAADEFTADRKKLNVRIGANEFTDRYARLDLQDARSVIRAELRFDDVVRYPRSFLSPGIMGPFSFVPGMECYHGVVNISHTLSGSIRVDGLETDMTGGEGYIEKDWGRSFPSAWIWLQANHFAQRGASFMFSIARIPWLGTSFPGLISFLKTPDGFYKFATYNGAHVHELNLEGNTLTGTLQRGAYLLCFTASYRRGGLLKAPKNGLMNRTIEESITAEVSLRLCHGSSILFEGQSGWAGMELAGQPGEILASR